MQTYAICYYVKKGLIQIQFIIKNLNDHIASLVVPEAQYKFDTVISNIIAYYIMVAS